MTAPIHLDHNATTPVAPEVVEAMAAVLAGPWMNPSARYPRAAEIAGHVRTARAAVANLLAAQPADVVFTSGGSEAIATAFHAAAHAGIARAVTSTVEHSAVKACAERLKEMTISRMNARFNRIKDDVTILVVELNPTGAPPPLAKPEGGGCCVIA